METDGRNPEKARLQDPRWRRWGPYLSDRQWGTIREDYSHDGSFWGYFNFEQSRSRAYRWGEDGLAGFSDDHQRLCLGIALWNHQDPILKERLFGLTNEEANHGEDVKECYYYLDAVPSHAYLKMLYKYPQRRFPYDELKRENRRRNDKRREYELVDTGCFDEDRYFDVFVEYAKAEPDDLLMQVTIFNRGPESARIDLLPQLWFRNTWSWHGDVPKPSLSRSRDGCIVARDAELGEFYFFAEHEPPWLFCENETHPVRVHGFPSATGYFKDGIHDYVVGGISEAVNPAEIGTKAAAHHSLEVAAGGQVVVRCRLTNRGLARPFEEFEQILAARRREADSFYEELQAAVLEEDARNVQRQALAGMIWNKQFYHYDVYEWLEGDSTQPKPPLERQRGRNARWQHLCNQDVISMPDKWEFPWYATWDIAFHCVTFALIDPGFAKDQLVLFTSERYMHPNGQFPAYEGHFSDVNPPVHAWAAWQVFLLERGQRGGPGDLTFLERIFHKLLLNFSWWVNRKDERGLNLFEGGFLGLDNIGVFDRGRPLPNGGYIAQADATSWMAMYALDMMRIALELAKHNSVYEDIASKFFQHFLHIAKAMHNVGDSGIGIWDEGDHFYYDVLNPLYSPPVPMKVRSIVGLIPLFAVETLSHETLIRLPHFEKEVREFLERRPDLSKLVSQQIAPGGGPVHLLALPTARRIASVLSYALDEEEFLSPFGIRALSRKLGDSPYCMIYDGQRLCIDYQPGEGDSEHFGSNSNWRGPIWFPINFLMIGALRQYYRYYGDTLKIECPTNSGRYLDLSEIAAELSHRLCRIFFIDRDGKRPVFGDYEKFQTDRHFRDYILFHEYFHGETGRGCGASHQTGWTGLVANLIGSTPPRAQK